MWGHNIAHTYRGLIKFTTFEKPFSVQGQDFLRGVRELEPLI